MFVRMRSSGRESTYMRTGGVVERYLLCAEVDARRVGGTPCHRRHKRTSAQGGLQKTFCGSLGMPAPINLSPTGIALDPTEVLTGENGTDVSHGYPYRPVPGQVLHTRAIGQSRVPHVGMSGSVTAEVITGAPGSARQIIKLTSLPVGAKDTVQISLDTQNRPVLTVAYNGTIRASTPGGPALPAGTMVQVQATWDATRGHLSFLQLNGDPVPGSFTPPPGPWKTALMSYVLVGYGVNLATFNGTILSLQVGNLDI